MSKSRLRELYKYTKAVVRLNKELSVVANNKDFQGKGFSGTTHEKYCHTQENYSDYATAAINGFVDVVKYNLWKKNWNYMYFPEKGRKVFLTDMSIENAIKAVNDYYINYINSVDNSLCEEYFKKSFEADNKYIITYKQLVKFGVIEDENDPFFEYRIMGTKKEKKVTLKRGKKSHDERLMKRGEYFTEIVDSTLMNLLFDKMTEGNCVQLKANRNKNGSVFTVTISVDKE